MKLTQNAPRTAVVMGLALVTAACETTHSGPESLNRAPDLSRYATFQLTRNWQANDPEPPFEGDAALSGSALTLTSRSAPPSTVGRLSVSPEDCRDSPDPLCKRTFLLGGRLLAYSGSLQCYLKIRNDTSVAYRNQPLSGLCRDEAKRSFTLTLFSRK